jgi:hypothetical protein
MIHFGTWYNEYGGFHIHDYFSLMINQFPIVVVRRYKDNHSRSDHTGTYTVGIFGITFFVDSKV